jgi:CRISPR/Cas system-associated exonuclease Cas4 (RecB family)
VSASTWLIVLATIAAASLGVAVVLWHLGRNDLGVFWPSGMSRVLASDTSLAPTQILYDMANGLRGRPDYLVAQRFRRAFRIVPLEIKPQQRSRRLHDSHAVQLGVYLLVARAPYGVRAAPFGYVRYARAEFRVELTQNLENRVLQVATSIRAARGATVVHRSHDTPARCAGCPVRRHCDESLV